MDVEQYLARDSLDGEETVVMALMLPYYDAAENRVSKSAFEKPDTSVSRLAIYEIDKIIGIFKRDLDRPTRLVDGYGTMKVQDIRDAANGAEDLVLDVTEDPVTTFDHENLAHAEIVAFDKDKKSIKKRVSSGVAKRLLLTISPTCLRRDLEALEADSVDSDSPEA